MALRYLVKNGANRYQALKELQEHHYHNHQAGLEKDEITDEFPAITEGVNNIPAGTGDNRGKIKIAAGFAWFYDEEDMDSLTIIPVAASGWLNPNNFANSTDFSDQTIKIIAAKRVDKTATWVMITDPLLLDGITYVPYIIAYKRTNSTSCHTQPYTLQAHGEIECIHQRLMLADRYAIESGFSDIAVAAGTLEISTATKQYVFAGSIRMELPEISADTRHFKVGRDGVISSAPNPKVINTMSDEGAGWGAMDPGKWVINWIFRGIEHQDHLYTMLSKQFSTLEEAQAYTYIGTLDPLISSHAVPVAKIIVYDSLDVDPANIETKSTLRW